MSSVGMVFSRVSISRRRLLGASVAAIAWPQRANAAERKTVVLELSPATLDLGQQQPLPASTFKAITLPRLDRGDVAEVTVRNTLPVAAAIHWRGLDGAPELQPWLARPLVAAGATAVFTVPLRHAGTLLCEARASDGARIAATAIVVAESTAAAVDADETLLVEAWPGPNPDMPIYSVNQRRTPMELKSPSNARLRLRFINASHHFVFAMQLPGLTPIIMAIDGQPCEPFAARDARVVLMPGNRLDVIVDATGAPETVFPISLKDGRQSLTVATLTLSAPARAAPLPSPLALPSNGLPERLALATALRIDLAMDNGVVWTAPAAMSASVAPSFAVKRGRTVVLALSNPSDRAMVFHLNGHHFRLLDKLDDGWKPFWLDTVAVPARQTIRIAFAAEHLGAYLLEASALEPGAATRMRSYRVIA